MDLSKFKETDNFLTAIRHLFKEDLDVPMNIVNDEPTSFQEAVADDLYKENETTQLVDDVYFVGMIDDAAFDGNESLAPEKIETDYDGILVFGITLGTRGKGLLPTRAQLAEISRALNRTYKYTPVVSVFKYADEQKEYLAFANTERLKYKQEWREGEKAGKVSLLRDIDIEETHIGHLRILKQLRINKKGKNSVSSFSDLYFYWQSIFSISLLNKKFYEDIINWFNWAIEEIKIPGQNKKSEKHKDFSIRLISRLIFIWFLKELEVVNEDLLLPRFHNGKKNLLIKPNAEGSSYYKFILQNLFFNALNAEEKDRNKTMFDVYSSDYEKTDKIKDIIFSSPFLNGGLFDIQENDWCEIDARGDHIVNNALVVPDDIFLDEHRGLNSILASYKFTIAENTPAEEEIAVDPEMLGRIFENLLAEQSDDTRDAARSNKGAFYTPRPVVSYMCRNTLLRHLDMDIKTENGKQVIHKMLETTILDPACGSGAFPMGMLEEMMQVLEKVDPKGNLWVAEMFKSKDQEFIDHISDFVADDQIRYVKKLGLLKNCLFGIDILDYAVEITKLRCWLSLIVEQKVDSSKSNYNLKPLPNLEFKFYKKNTLLRHYRDQNLNDLIGPIDNKNLLDELVNLENEYFITKSSRHGTKEQIKAKIINLLEKLVDDQSKKTQKELNVTRKKVNYLIDNRYSSKKINAAKKKVRELARQLEELVLFRKEIKDYFIERIVFPGIFSAKKENPGFDMIIGNPPYVNTKQIKKMKLTRKLEAEYGYCDDLYNHFTIRGLELLKKRGLLSYITSDTFLTLQSKKNMRMQFLGIPKVSRSGDGLFAKEKKELPECRVADIINTPKAFSALVDTAIFTLVKEQADESASLTYVDLRKPTADSFGITEKEWNHIKTSKENLASWESVLEHTFTALGHDDPDWSLSHSCDGDEVYKDQRSSLLKFKLSFEPYRKAINYAIFAPTPYNCQVLEKIIKPARPVFDQWWRKIETSRQIETYRANIKRYTDNLDPGDITMIGLLTDGGQGLATGNNGRFVGYRSGTRYADRCRETRIEKLFNTIFEHPEITSNWNQLAGVQSKTDLEVVINNLAEQEIWKIFDEIKEKYGLRVFGKGYMYRIVPPELEFDTATITDDQKVNGIFSETCWVPYDKGDKEGNRWYLETPYLIDWSIEAVNVLSTDSRARWQGYNFFFRNGFCWNAVLNPNSNYIKCRLKQKSVNDVQSMSLYSEIHYIPDDYIVTVINSFLSFKALREFINGSAAVQMNDIRKLPIKIPSDDELAAFNSKFDECLTIQQRYFNGEIEKAQARAELKPLEEEIDEMVNQLYDITASVKEEEVGDEEILENE